MVVVPSGSPVKGDESLEKIVHLLPSIARWAAVPTSQNFYPRSTVPKHGIDPGTTIRHG